ncbi:medium-chain acyl-CoA ligase ACSF2, mitochondrial isoform X2 [Xiphias gladius]|uniref:medium-chain acyl-CoA ligase ACSF2, mitochondrial isoform X2 n=1 Tax=Xiphias gladius TaxID=8245 RepID=UPI001A998A05|nr:medium-chain acyl-CoA ligase ACSF2, mitochondrial isoform X2 [Xiphias gladius]
MLPRVAPRSRCLFLQRPWTRRPGLSAASRGIHVDSPPIIPSLTTSYAHGTSSTPLFHTTVGESLLRTAERWPDREALAFLQDGVRKTFAQLQQDVDQAAAGLLALGLKKGDRLGMWGPNTYEWVLFQFATAKAGIILVSVNPAFQLQEVEFALRKVGCKAVVCPTEFKTQKYCDMLRQICPEIESSSPGDIRSARLPDLRSVIVLDSRQRGMLHFEDVMQAGSSQYMQQLQDLQKKILFDDPINIQFTSGTTGVPKGATLTHHNIVNNAYFVGRRVGYTWRPNTRICLPVPLYHCFGSVGGGMCMAVHGVSLVFPSTGYDGKANIAALESERCTFIYGTPTMYVDMVNQPDLAKYDLSSLEAGIMAGSPCPPELVKKLTTVMGIKGITPLKAVLSLTCLPFCGGGEAHTASGRLRVESIHLGVENQKIRCRVFAMATRSLQASLYFAATQVKNIKGAQLSFLGNKQKLCFHSVSPTKTHCVSLSANKLVSCISFHIKHPEALIFLKV